MFPILTLVKARPAPSEPRADSQAVRQVPDAAFVQVRASRPALVARIGRMPLRHVLMLTLAAALMATGGIYAHKRPMQRAIVIPIPAGHGVVVT